MQIFSYLKNQFRHMSYFFLINIGVKLNKLSMLKNIEILFYF